MTNRNAMNLSNIRFLIIASICWSQTLTNNVQAQSFGDLKNLKEQVKKKLVPTVPKKTKNPMNRQGLEKLTNKAKLEVLNENSKSSRCFKGNEFFDGKKRFNIKSVFHQTL